MSSIKRDDNKQKWEDTEFPLACETCLGDNPYIRMTKEPYGKACSVCGAPFTVFAWQAGTKGRLKRVEICRSCAQAKNVCQVCIYDLQYGLPVKVRDKVLREAGNSGSVTAVPQSKANRAWFAAQQERALAQSQDLVGDPNELAVAKLKEMANMEPRYERNMAKLCSFFAKGECNRGSNCPFRHEMPRDRNDPMSKQDTKSRFYGTSDPVANRILGRQRRREEAKQEVAEGYDRAQATLYLRFVGDAPFPRLTEADLRDQFYSFGEIVSVRVQADRGQAFVEYTQPEAAELAIASMNRKSVLSRQIHVAWARAPKRGEVTITRRGEENTETAKAPRRALPITPPGVSSLPIPKNLVPAKLPPEVAAMAAARRQKAATVGVPRPSSNVPRPGGGPVRKAGVNAAKRSIAPSKPYYPSADPKRLGTTL